ncbi:restriction endonuclease subunit S [Methanobrevibacter smithii]|uniref:restriction endonuclease subunit S n=1 Tax=Methanobrevibacter smithii TaxID=2173 RepID=UPI0037DC1887
MSFSRNTFTNIFGEISSEFNVYTIEDIASDEKRSIISGPFGSNISSKYFTEHGVPVIRGNNLTEDNTKFIDGGFVFVSEEKAKELNTYADVDDLVFTAAGTIGQVGIIPKNSKFDRYIISNKQLRVTLDLNKVNQHYAYYWFSSKLINKYIKQLNTGSTIPLINLSILKGLPIPLPSKDLQDKIANIIINIDKKIETNERINKNLEKTLITIFNSWFINFENYDNSKGMKIDDSYGEIPVDWSVEMLEDYVDFVTGVEPGSKNYHEKPEPNDIPFLRVGDLGSRDNGVFIDPSLSKNKILKYDDIVLSLDATIGIVKMGLEGAYSTGMRKLVIKNDNINQPFLYCLVKSNRIQRIIETFATGTTILHAGKSIKHMNFVLSDKKTMDDFGKIGNPIISIILTNLKEIEYLTNLRDTLLPKLMSGEIDVSKINCDLELKYNYMKYLFNQIHTPMSKSVV